jgi:stage II sporulation protein D
MKKLYYLRIYTLLFLCFFFKEGYCEQITILLEKIDLTENTDKKIFTFKNVTKIANTKEKNQYFILDTPQEVVLAYYPEKKKWYLNNQKLLIQNVTIFSSTENHIVYKDNFYDHSLELLIDNNSLYLLHTTELENYVTSVVVHEVYPEWPDSALEAAAITARTYALHKKIEANKKNKLFHIKNSTEHQKYNGITANERVKKAVLKTENLIISYDNNPILAMYHVCCGGVLPIDCQGYDFIKHPYLKRNKKCTGCEAYKKYLWEATINEEDFCKNIEKIMKIKVKKIKKISHTIKSKSGAIRRIEVLAETRKSKRYPIRLNNKQLRKTLNIKLWQHSSHFKLQKEGDNFKIQGRGQGHHIGLCQRGMFGYSKQGDSAEKILSFYYPGTTIKKYNQTAIN